MTTLTPEDRARLRDLAHRMLETPVRGAASTALAEGVTALLDALDAAEAAIERVREMHISDADLPRPWCRECDCEHPCPTVRALDGDA